jgi:asparagine synthetase B (glutamine-hydrolysing)
LDSTIAACLGKDILGLRAAFTVTATPSCTDREHAQVAAAAAGLEHHLIDTDLEGVLQELPVCVRVLQTFDGMSLRNELAGWCRGGGQKEVSGLSSCAPLALAS